MTVSGATFADLPRLRRPRPPAHLPADLRPVWCHLAPQVCAWAAVTRLDVDALAALCAVAADTQTQAARLAQKTGAARRKLWRAHLRRRALLWEACQDFLLGPEPLEEITMPDGAALSALLAGLVGRQRGSRAANAGR